MVGLVLLVLVLITAGAWVALRECSGALTQRGERIAALTAVTGFLGILAFGGGAMLAHSQSTSATTSALSSSVTSAPTSSAASTTTTSAATTSAAPTTGGYGDDSTTDEALSGSWATDNGGSEAAVSGDSGTSAGSAYYKNCAAVRDAGEAPLTPDDPGYRSQLDRDDDGLACE